jgi:ribosomal protein S18 acetylase RimI-like enzyme
MADLVLRRRNAADVPGLRTEILDVHADAHGERLHQPFYTVERYAERLDRYVEDPTFALVTGQIAGLLVGFAFGGTLSAETRWWQGLRDVDDPDVARETGRRTFAFREIQVRQAFRRRGYAHQLHDELLRGRTEERATLLVRPDNPARDLYLRWGWRIVGKLQPYPDSPVFDAMVRELPI